jgi:hypothetical protein
MADLENWPQQSKKVRAEVADNCRDLPIDCPWPPPITSYRPLPPWRGWLLQQALLLYPQRLRRRNKENASDASRLSSNVVSYLFWVVNRLNYHAIYIVLMYNREGRTICYGPDKLWQLLLFELCLAGTLNRSLSHVNQLHFYLCILILQALATLPSLRSYLVYILR